jgi:F0F1-type ATP synthase assembly protein I
MSRDPDPEPPKRRSALPERLRYKPMNAAYQGAFESVAAIGITMAAGWWADRHWDTSPLWLLVGATIGFAAFVLRLYRLGAAVGEAGESGDSAAAGSAGSRDRGHGRGETSPENPARPESRERSGSEGSPGDRS